LYYINYVLSSLSKSSPYYLWIVYTKPDYIPNITLKPKVKQKQTFRLLLTFDRISRALFSRESDNYNVK